MASYMDFNDSSFVYIYIYIYIWTCIPLEEPKTHLLALVHACFLYVCDLDVIIHFTFQEVVEQSG